MARYSEAPSGDAARTLGAGSDNMAAARSRTRPFAAPMPFSPVQAALAAIAGPWTVGASGMQVARASNAAAAAGNNDEDDQDDASIRRIDDINTDEVAQLAVPLAVPEVDATDELTWARLAPTNTASLADDHSLAALAAYLNAAYLRAPETIAFGRIGPHSFASVPAQAPHKAAQSRSMSTAGLANFWLHLLALAVAVGGAFVAVKCVMYRVDGKLLRGRIDRCAGRNSSLRSLWTSGSISHSSTFDGPASKAQLDAANLVQRRQSADSAIDTATLATNEEDKRRHLDVLAHKLINLLNYRSAGTKPAPEPEVGTAQVSGAFGRRPIYCSLQR